MKTSRRTFINWTGTSLLSAGLSGAPRAEPQAQGAERIALGTPTPVGIGEKYAASGKALLFPGNTILCHVHHANPVHAVLTEVTAALQAKLGDKKIAWTPPPSYHMTLFDGSLDTRRRPGDWPHMLPLNASLEACNIYIGHKLKAFNLGMELPIRMVVDEELATKTDMHYPMRPVDAAEGQRVRRLRDRLSESTGIRHANHDSYQFHATFGYYIQPFDSLAAERRYQELWLAAIREIRRRMPVIELGAPEYCLFNTMDDFQVQFLLTNK